jgi:hypothetical protein
VKYPELDPSSLEPDFSQHMSALTTEALHSKGAIAEQLAWRDRQLAAALAKVEELEQELEHVWAAARTVVAADTYVTKGKTRFEATTEAIGKLERLLPQPEPQCAAVEYLKSREGTT